MPQSPKNKSSYMAVIHHANQMDYKVIQIDSINQLMKMIYKFEYPIIMKFITKWEFSSLLKAGINPEEIDFMITIYNSYIE